MAAEEANLQVPSEMYLKSGIHIGTKFKTKYMERFIYKTRSDGLSVLNIKEIDERIGLMADLLAKYQPEEILVVSRRESGWKPIKMLGKLTGVKVYAGRYPPGMLTNPEFRLFCEPKVIVAIDAWPDRNAILDALRVGIPVVALCDTNNQVNNIDFVVPCNNKGKKSLALLFWIITNKLLRSWGRLKEGESISETVDDFTQE